ncbi:D12 class N6 adenine-specific DNA methyltransferase [Candidatus Glomeribacter gigasporarum BEG34]|uniref:site-specific DNA-methyltransferase (adenine-specific) n=1 Tax=Candidatus Glomeribacter gigasporarum BEG34 TaxID=1070319 RepID=G2J843_9BURK|nr:DNA adenine methylase [Candidatus Glomeribacter gigasporarum]CCD28940.1 D12 class N6 adenine-specific DNA methyltransferase [Candidatus Glomeribacter gigasporarum BEG34]
MTKTTPIIQWMGGKRRLAKHLLPLFPPHHCYVEVFCGAAALFFMRPEPAPVEVINDLNRELVNLYRVVQHHLEEFIRQFKWAISSRQVFEWQKMTRPETLTEIQRAARFYYVHRHCFGAQLRNPSFGTSASRSAINLLRIEESLSEAYLRLSGVTVENLDWQDCIQRYDRPHTFFYLDPPYWQMAGYDIPFEFEQYERMAEVMRNCQGKMMVSINDHPEMRRVFAGFPERTLQTTYTLNGRSRSEKRRECVVMSWEASV